MTFVEVLDRRGGVRSRIKVETLPFRIGRAYDCDLILDDPHVSPHHAVLESDAEGRLVLRDAGSRNGLHVEGSRDRVSAVPLSRDVTVVLGRTPLRLRSADFAVPEAVPIVQRAPLAEWMFEHWSAAVVIPAIWMGLLLFDHYRTSTNPFEPTQAFSDTAWSLLAYGVWIGGFSLCNRLLRHRTRFVAHSTVAFVGSCIYTVVQWSFEWLRFLIPTIDPLRLADQFATTAIWSLVLLGHLTVMGVAQRRVRVGIVGVGFCAILGLQVLDHYNQDMDWVTTLPYWSRLEPVDADWLPAESPDAFFAAIPDLGVELDELARKANEEKEAREAEERDASGPDEAAPPEKSRSGPVSGCGSGSPTEVNQNDSVAGAVSSPWAAGWGDPPRRGLPQPGFCLRLASDHGATATEAVTGGSSVNGATTGPSATTFEDAGHPASNRIWRRVRRTSGRGR